MVVDTKLYDILGVDASVDAAKLKKAYRDLVRVHHPDKGGDPEKFKAIDAAYKILGDPRLRDTYDNTGSVDRTDVASGMFPDGFDVESLGDIFANMGFDIFGGMGSPSFRNVRRTRDVYHELHLPLDALYTGKVKTINVKRTAICVNCKGKGGTNPITCNVCRGSGVVIVQQQTGPFIVQSQKQCDTCGGGGKTHSRDTLCTCCGGKGHVLEKKMVEVRIPPGAPNGFLITTKHMVDERLGFESGDLHFVVREKSHDTFVRHGADLATKIAIDLATALVGGIVRYKHIDGQDMTLTLSKGKVTRYGDSIKVQGKGMPRFGEDGNGDLHVTFHIEMPSDEWAMRTNEASVRKMLAA